MQRLGGKGPRLLILHATGFHGLAYTPLATALEQQFDCYTLDFPGHGTAAGTTLANYTVSAVAEYLMHAVESAGLRGCFCFGHSAGGAFAILAGSRCVLQGLRGTVHLCTSCLDSTSTEQGQTPDSGLGV
jgi:alpha-beta hydrolase superfamily lysophospholipase